MQLLLWDMLRPVVKPLVDRVVGAMNVAGVIRPEATAKVVVRPRKSRGGGGGGAGGGGSRGKARRPGASGGEASSTGAVVGEVVRQGGEGGEIGGGAPLSERGGTKKMSAQDRYDAVTRAMLAQYGIKVRKWRTSMSGVAYELKYRDGTIKRLIESPYPKSPMSAAIFLHEIGHHAIGFHTYKPRCLEEYHAWKWS
ncbi:MAG: hypothetical protein MUE97_03020, partial [Phycisphaerales bacterium]|nr:hypothetical protein [Phycisphaerales bacterium]